MSEGIEAIRERRPKAKNDTDLLSGPGKIGAALAVTGDDTGTDLLDERSKIRIVAGREAPSVLAGPRVGLKDGVDHGLMWRFIDEEHAEWASSPRL